MTTAVTITVRQGNSPNESARRQRVSIALTVLFVAWVMGWLWWLAAAAAVLGAVVAGVRWFEQRRDRLAAVVARADKQHAWVLDGDPRGTYGESQNNAMSEM